MSFYKNYQLTVHVTNLIFIDGGFFNLEELIDFDSFIVTLYHVWPGVRDLFKNVAGCSDALGEIFMCAK